MLGNNKYIKILVIILLGALGSGVWEYLIKPSFETISESTLNIITFGIKSFQNDLYSEIAVGLYERGSLNGLSLLTSIYTMGGIFLILYSKNLVFEKNSDIDNLKNSLTTTSFDEQKEIIENFMIDLKKRLRKLYYFLFFIITTSILIYQFNSLRLSYINKSIASYNQFKNISRPYISQKELLLIESNFALIKNKNDYERIIEELKKVIEINNLNIK
jgi:hypothetical protein